MPDDPHESGEAVRANYISAEATEALEQVLRETFNVSWKIDITVEGKNS